MNLYNYFELKVDGSLGEVRLDVYNSKLEFKLDAEEKKNKDETLYYQEGKYHYFTFEGKIYRLMMAKIVHGEAAGLYTLTFKTEEGDYSDEIGHSDLTKFFSIVMSIVKRERTKGDGFTFNGEKREKEEDKNTGKTTRDKLYLRILNKFEKEGKIKIGTLPSGQIRFELL